MKYIKTSRAAMPTTCWGDYRRVAVMEGEEPKIIRTCSKYKVVEVYDKLNCGITTKSAYGRVLVQLIKDNPDAKLCPQTKSLAQFFGI